MSASSKVNKIKKDKIKRRTIINICAFQNIAKYFLKIKKIFLNASNESFENIGSFIS